MHIADRVWFKKPEYDRLKKQGFTLVDMHLHSREFDGILSAKGLMKKARKLGIGFAVTDHNEIKVALKMHQEDFFTIPGIEVNAKDKDLLVYFYNVNELKEFYEKDVEPYRYKLPSLRIYKRFAEVLEDTKDYNCVTSVAHPYGWLTKASARMLKKNSHVMREVDAIEVMNGGNTKTKNRKAVNLANQHSKCFTGGTDAHSITEFGRVVTYAKADDVESFLDAIRKKQNFVMGKGANKVTCAIVQGVCEGRKVSYPLKKAGNRAKSSIRVRVNKIRPSIRKSKKL